MTKIYLSTKQELQSVSGDVATISTQLNNPTTGLSLRVSSLEALGGGGGMTAQQATELAACVADKHSHANKAVLDAIEASYTAAEKAKLGNITDNFKGLFASSTARDFAIVAPGAGNYVLQADTNTVWYYSGVTWVNTGSTAAGDMLKSVYDPTSKQKDAFDMDSMAEGAANKILTSAERSKLKTYRGYVNAIGMGLIAGPASGDYCIRQDTRSVWVYEGGNWGTAGQSSLSPKFERHQEAAQYTAGDVVLFGGALFSANLDINGLAAPVPFAEGVGANKWTRTGGSTPLGAIIHWEGVKYGLAVPDGYALCDGSTINYPGSLLHGQNAPDHRGRVLAGANGGAHTADTMAGADSAILARSSLPNVTLSGVTGNESNTHTHLTNSYTHTGVANSAYATSSTYPNVIAFAASKVVVSDNGAALGGTTANSYLALDGADQVIADMDTSHSHSVSITLPDKTSNSNTALHTHSFTTNSLNGGVAQSSIDIRQATRYVSTLIKL